MPGSSASVRDPFAGLKYKPLARGKQKDSFALSAPGLAVGHFWEGTVRSGKTIVSILRWLLFVIKGPPGNLAMIGKTERTLKRNVLDIIVDLIGEHRCKVTMGTGEVEILGRRIYVAGANNEAAVSKIAGMTLVGFYGDEVPTWPQTVFDMARTRLSEPGASWFATGNPASSTHHLKTEWIDYAKLHLTRDGTIIRRQGEDAKNVHVYSFSLYDNPFLPADYLRELEASYTGMFRRRYILGEWCLAEGAIYDSWDPDIHVVRPGEMPPMDEWLSTGVDYGTTNPFHAVALGFGPRIERFVRERGPGKALYVFGEYRYDSARSKRRMTDLQYAEALMRWTRQAGEPGGFAEGLMPEMTAIDPSATSFRTQLYHSNFASRIADNDVLPGIRTVSNLFGSYDLLVSADCPELIKEIPGYVWDDKAAALGEDKPLKVNDHGCDAKRYAVRTSRGMWRNAIYPDLDVDDV